MYGQDTVVFTLLGWPSGLRRGYVADLLLGLRVRIPPPPGGLNFFFVL